MSIMIIPTTAIILTTTTPTNPIYGQPDKTSFNVTDSSNLQSILAKKVLFCRSYFFFSTHSSLNCPPNTLLTGTDDNGYQPMLIL